MWRKRIYLITTPYPSVFLTARYILCQNPKIMVEVHQEHVLVLNLEGHLGPPLWSSSYSVIVKDKPI